MPTAQTPLPDEEGHQSDPTALTTQQLWREIAHLSKLIEIRLETVATRFNDMDKAIALLQEFTDRSPSIAVVNNELQNLKESIQDKFKDSQTAIEKALNAAEKSVEKQNENFSEANDKSEKSVTKEIDAVKANIAQNTKSIDDKIAALDKRLTEINGHDKGVSSSWAVILGSIGGIVGLISIIGFIITLTRGP